MGVMKRKKIIVRRMVRYKIFVSGVNVTNPLIFYDAPIGYLINSSILKVCNLPFQRCVVARPCRAGRVLYFMSTKDFKNLPSNFKKDLQANRSPRSFNRSWNYNANSNSTYKERLDSFFKKYHDLLDSMIKIRVTKVSLRNPVAKKRP